MGSPPILRVIRAPRITRAGAPRVPSPVCEMRCTTALLSPLRLASVPPVSALLSACAPPVRLPLLGLVRPGPPGPPAPVPALALPHTPRRRASKRSDHEEHTESCSHLSPYLPVGRVYEVSSGERRIRHEGVGVPESLLASLRMRRRRV